MTIIATNFDPDLKIVGNPRLLIPLWEPLIVK
jgi:hypothetical protein